MRFSTNRAAYWIICVLILCAALSCNKSGQTEDEPDDGAWRDKIGFDLSQIRDDGLTGPPDGLVSVSYEFCIPDDSGLLRRVLAIDPAITMQSEPPGRVGCGRDELLCIGNTHNPNWRSILRQIASLDFVDRIERTHFE